MKKAVIAALLAAVALSGCTQPTEKVAVGDTVSVDYKGSLTDGTVFDSSEVRGPFEFTVGAGEAIKGFDNAVIGMDLNEEKTVTLQPSQAYGDYNSQKVWEIPKVNIQNVDELTVGMVLTSPSTGANGVIKEIREDTVVVDFNHELAGKTLVFWIKVVGITNA